MKIAIVGQGYVGLPLAMAAARVGHKVIGLELNLEKVALLNSATSYVSDVPNVELKKYLYEGTYIPQSNFEELRNCDIVIICVPTPLDDKGEPDLSALRAASRNIANNVSDKTLIINESTSYPGTLRREIKPIFDAICPQLDLMFAVSPERVDPGNTKFNITNTPRTVSGLSDEAIMKAQNFYSTFCESVSISKLPEIVEMAKVFENTFRFVNISLVNELSEICQKFNISTFEVLKVAETKPYGFMRFNPSLGIGGHCIPIDPMYLSFASHEKGVNSRFIKSAQEINDNNPHRIVTYLEDSIGRSFSGLRVLILGVAYKSNTSDTRESPASTLYTNLLRKGCQVAWYDPHVKEWEFPGKILEITETYDLIIINVWHDDFVSLNLANKSKYILDCSGNLSSELSL